MAPAPDREDDAGMKGELPHHPHQCPCCELRFAWRTELLDHIVADHEGGPDTTVTFDDRRRSTARR
jgi:hypothetical protein